MFHHFLNNRETLFSYFCIMPNTMTEHESREYSIRRATVEDVPMIVAHRRNMVEDIHPSKSALLGGMSAAFEPWLVSRMSNGKYLGWLVVAADGSVVAGIGLWLIDWPPTILSTAEYRGYILNVYTDPAHRKQGLARRLTQTALDWCHDNDINVIVLHASPFGRPLYESMGFTPGNEMRLILEE